MMTSSAEPRPSDLRERISRVMADLPRQQKLVAAYFLDHLQEIPFLGVPALSHRAGASEATVVRFAQRLGYEGFAELKSDLLEVVRRRVVPGSDFRAVPEALTRDGRDDTLSEVARQEVDNIQHSVAHLDHTAFQSAAAALFRADHVYVFGQGISSHLAGVMCYLLAQIGIRASRLSTGFSSPLEQLVVLRPTDMLVVFSFPPYSRSTLELVRRAIDDGIPTLGICDRLSAPVGTLARFTLPVRSDNMMFTNSFAAASVLLNALITEIAMRNRDHAVKVVGEISHILDDDEGLLK